MKIVLIGSHLCQDTMYALYKLKDLGAEVEFKNISVNFQDLKEFLNLRETNPLYTPIKEKNGIGMPFFRLENGLETLNLKEVLEVL